MEDYSVLRARQPDEVGQRIRINAWVRTRRDSKAGFSFVEVNDGSCMSNLQVIIDKDVTNYETDVKRLTAGCSVTFEGELKESQGKGQATEIQASEVTPTGALTLDAVGLKGMQEL